MPKHTIVSSATGSEFVIDESTTLNDIRNGEPLFFKTPHGKRESFATYRGFLIVRNTVQFTGAKPQRKTTVYLYTDDMEGEPGTLCVSGGHDLAGIPHAKRLIDTIIETKSYAYGMELKD